MQATFGMRSSRLKRIVRWHVACISLVVVAAAMLPLNPVHRSDGLLFSTPTSSRMLSHAFPALPLTFEANAGQWEAGVLFAARGRTSSAFFRNDGFEILPSRSGAGRLRLRFVKASVMSAPAAGTPALTTRTNYFLGSDASRWISDVPNYGGITYRELWPGVDLRIYGNQGRLEQDFIVRPGDDPRAIGMQLEDGQGASIDDSGDLVLPTQGGEVRLHRPVAYQLAGDRKKVVDAEYAISDRRISFTVKDFDLSLALIIDPVVTYSTSLGGSGDDEARGIAVDSSGNVYVTGVTDSTNFPTASPLHASSGGKDVFVLKLNAAGNSLLYSTYLGGSADDVGNAIAVDVSGNAYVTGGTGSINFPTTPMALQTALRGTQNAFVTVLNPTGSALVYSTYLGGSGGDSGFGIAVDPKGQAHAVGETNSPNFPTVAAIQASLSPSNQSNFTCLPGPCPDAFVAAIDATGSSLVYSTYLGGGASDEANGVAVDATGSAYVVGDTFSTQFPVTAGVFQSSLGGLNSAFVSRFDPTGNLLFSTYLGGSQGGSGSTSTIGLAVAVDLPGNAYVTGTTDSTNFPVTANAYQSKNAGNFNAFVAKLNPTGTALPYASYVGGNTNDSGNAIAVDGLGNIYLAGETNSGNFPLVAALQPYFGATDAFILKMNAGGSTLKYSTYWGGSRDDHATAIALDSSGAYIAGRTSSSDFPGTSALQPGFGGNVDAFVLKVVDAQMPPSSTTADLSVSMTASTSTIQPGQSITYTVKVSNAGPNAAANVMLGDSLPDNTSLVSAMPSQGTCNSGFPLTCALGTLAVGATTTVTITLQHDNTIGPFANTAHVSSDASDPTLAENSATVNSVSNNLGIGIGGGVGGGGCFIATAAWGSYLDPHVQALRDFRDRHLMTNLEGRAFVSWYYRHSPPAARLIAGNSGLRLATRVALTPVVFAVSYPMTALGVGIAALGLLWVIRRERFAAKGR